MILKFIAFLHLGTTIFNALYFLIPKTWFDFVFLTWIYVSFLSWTLTGGQCAISYFLKKYCLECDQTSIDSDDMIGVFGPKYQDIMRKCMNCLFALNTLSISCIVLRNKLPIFIYLLPLFAYYGLSYLRNVIINGIFFVIFLITTFNSLRFLKNKLL